MTIDNPNATYISIDKNDIYIYIYSSHNKKSNNRNS